MHLPILQSSDPPPSNEDRLRLFLRTQLHWGQILGEETALDVGTAIVNGDLPNLPEANFVIQAALADGQSPAEAVRAANEHFAAHGSRCGQWFMNHGSPPEHVRPLVEYLMANGYERQSMRVMYLAGAPPQIAEAGGLKIIPARASYRHARQLADAAAREPGQQDLAQTMLLHLDDPNWDSVLALEGSNAVATAGVLSVGDIGRLDQLYVAPSRRRQGVGRTMIARALEICARSVFQQVMAATRPDQQAAAALLAGLGFVAAGEIPVYRARGF